MATKRTISEAETLELYRVSLENVEKQPFIAESMAEIGYDETTISEGNALLREARQTFDINKTEDNETSAAYAAFVDAKAKLEETYALHRKKAKVVFRNDPLILDRLEISGSRPNAYISWLENIKTFYKMATHDPSIQSSLSRLKVSVAELNESNKLIVAVESARADYLREKGESQDATKKKDDAMAKIDDWMIEFYAVAKIALDDKPQLAESLGKLVRS